MTKFMPKITGKNLEQNRKLEERSIAKNLFDLPFVLSVNAFVDLMHIMKIIQNLLKSSGCVLLVIFTIIKEIDFTLIDLARKLRKEMQKSGLTTKALEGNPKRSPRLRNQVNKVTERTNDAWVINLRATLA